MMYERVQKQQQQKIEYLWKTKKTKMKNKRKKNRQKMLWSDKSCDMMSIHRQDEVSRAETRATTKGKKRAKVKTSQCIVTYTILASSERDFAWIISILFPVPSYREKVKMNTVTTETKWIWRCIPKMKFHFMNEFANAIEKLLILSLHTYMCTYKKKSW